MLHLELKQKDGHKWWCAIMTDHSIVCSAEGDNPTDATMKALSSLSLAFEKLRQRALIDGLLPAVPTGNGPYR